MMSCSTSSGVKRPFRRGERDPISGEVAEIGGEHERRIVIARKDDSAPVGEVHSRRPSFDLIEYGRQPICAKRDDVHPADESAQSPNGRWVILQPVLRPRDGRFARDEARGNRAKGPHGPRMIDVAAVDSSLKRSGVDDDGSSRRDDGGPFHVAWCDRVAASLYRKRPPSRRRADRRLRRAVRRHRPRVHRSR